MEQGWPQLGQAIRTRRKQAGLSQERLAELARSHSTYISEIENGHVNPTVGVARRIAEAMGIPLSVLIEDAEQSD